MPTMLEQMGGISGIVASSIPVAVFVVANLLFELRPALIAALVAGVLVAAWRIARRQRLQPAVSGLLGVGVAAFIAYRTGEARGFYLPGLIYSAVFARGLPGLGAGPLAAGRGDLARHQRARARLAPRSPAAARLHLRQPAVDRGVRGPAGRAGPALQRRRGDLARHRPAGHGLSAGRRRPAGHGLGGAPGRSRPAARLQRAPASGRRASPCRRGPPLGPGGEARVGDPVQRDGGGAGQRAVVAVGGVQHRRWRGPGGGSSGRPR